MAKKPLFKINWEDEITAKGDGHKYVTTTPPHPHGEKRDDRNKRYVYTHIAVMELHLGRLIDSNKEEIHHKNGNPADNRLSNLELKTKSDHSRGHALKKRFWKKSPRNKPGRKSARRVIDLFLNRNDPVNHLYASFVLRSYKK